MPQWIKDISPIVAAISILVNIALFMAKRKLEVRDKEERAAREAEADRQKVSREIAAKLAIIFNAFTVEATKTLEQVGELRRVWGSEALLIDLVHDEATGRKLTSLVSTYLDSITDLIQGNILSADLHTRRSEAWRQARDVLDTFVRYGPKTGV